jgi:hypothetical protein
MSSLILPPPFMGMTFLDCYRGSDLSIKNSRPLIITKEAKDGDRNSPCPKIHRHFFVEGIPSPEEWKSLGFFFFFSFFSSFSWESSEGRHGARTSTAATGERR